MKRTHNAWTRAISFLLIGVLLHLQLFAVSGDSSCLAPHSYLGMPAMPAPALVQNEMQEMDFPSPDKNVSENIGTWGHSLFDRLGWKHIFLLPAALEAGLFAHLGVKAVFGAFLPALGLALLNVLCLRFLFVSGMWMNELGHMLVGGMMGDASAFRKSNLLGNLPMLRWILSLLPFLNMAPSEDPHVSLELRDSKLHVARIGGFFLGAFIHFALTSAVLLLFPKLALAAWTVFALVTFLAFTSDLLPYFMKGLTLPPGTCFCGLGGLKLFGRMSLETILDILRKSGRNTENRGKQAAGVHITTPVGNTVFYKMVNPNKREKMTDDLLGRVFDETVREILEKNETVSMQGHGRFGTSSAPSVGATHPHTFIESEDVTVWVHGARKGWFKVSRKLRTTIGHNGDLNAIHFESMNFGNLFDMGVNTELNVSTFHDWLNGVFAEFGQNSTPGDSVNLAGFVNLFHTQGMWKPSLRLAYYQALAGSLTDHISGDVLRQWEEEANTVFEAFSKTSPKMSAEKLTEHLKQNLKFLAPIPPSKRDTFVSRLVENFAKGTLENAFLKFQKAAKGTFAVSATSNHPRGEDAYFVRGQPQYLAFFEDFKGVANYSERANTKILDPEGKPYFRYMLPFKDTQGEVASIYPDYSGGALKMGFRLTNLLSGKRYLSIQELEEDRRLVDMKDNDLLTKLPKTDPDANPNLDVIEADMQDSPRVYRDIEKSFEDPEDPKMHNAQTASALFEKIKNLFEDNARRPKNPLDIVLVAEETSLTHAANFAAALSRQFNEQLRIQVVSGNQVMNGIYDLDEKTITMPNDDGTATVLDSKTIALNISQSGQSFSTAMATNVMAKFLKDNLFVLTGEMDSQMGEAIGQEYYKGAPFLKRIFTNHSGYRPSEASSLTSFATHKTLTHLLIALGQHLTDDAKFTYTHKIQWSSVLQERFERAESEHTDRLDQSRLFDPESPIRKEIQAQAKHYTWNLLEGAVALFITKIVVLVFVSTGWNPAIVLGAVLGLAFCFLIGRMLLGKPNRVASPSSLLKFFTGAGVLTACLWLFPSGWILALFYAGIFELLVYAIRVTTNRPLLDRVYGARSLVISDARWVQRLSHMFATKVFANSFGLLSVVIKSSQVRNVPHYFAHESVRGGMLFQGLSSSSSWYFVKERRAANMNAAQVNGIQNFGVGTQIQTVGNGSASKIGAQHTHVNGFDVRLPSPAKAFVAYLKKHHPEVPETVRRAFLKTLKEENLLRLFDEWKSYDQMAKMILKEVAPPEPYRVLLSTCVRNFLKNEGRLEYLLEHRFNAFTRLHLHVLLYDQIAKNVSNFFRFKTLKPLEWLIPSLKKVTRIFTWKRWMSHNGTRTHTTASPFDAEHILNIIAEMDRRERQAPPETKPEESPRQDDIRDEERETPSMNEITFPPRQEQELESPVSVFEGVDEERNASSEAVEKVSEQKVFSRLSFENWAVDTTGDVESFNKLVGQCQTSPELEKIYAETMNAFSKVKVSDGKWDLIIDTFLKQLEKISFSNREEKLEAFHTLLFRTAIVPKHQKSFMKHLQDWRPVLLPHVLGQFQNYRRQVDSFLKAVENTGTLLMSALNSKEQPTYAHEVFVSHLRDSCRKALPSMSADYSRDWIRKKIGFFDENKSGKESLITNLFHFVHLKKLHSDDRAWFDYLFFYALKGCAAVSIPEKAPPPFYRAQFEISQLHERAA